MKTIILLIILCFTSARAFADSTNDLSSTDWGCLVSKPSSNILVAIQYPILGIPDHYTTQTYFSAENQIIFGFCSKTNYNYEVFMLRPEYGYKLFAKSEDGKEVKPTRLGAHYGEKFDEIKGYDKDALDWTRGNGGNPNRPFWTVAHRDQPSLSRIFPSPQELFNFEKPGNYTVWIELQCLSRPSLPHSTNLYLVRFPPVKLQVIKKRGSKMMFYAIKGS